jgi:hypothetical protein
MVQRRIMMLAAAATVALAVAVTLGYLVTDDQPACGCSPMATVDVYAAPTADRFARLVRNGDVDNAWAMLTDAARTRYGDVAGFRPVAQRLATGYAVGGGADWRLLSPKAYGPPLGAVVARLPVADPADPAAVLRQAIMVVSATSSGEWRADPEPVIGDVRARADGPGRLRLAHPDTDQHRLAVWILDATGQRVTHSPAATPGSYTVYEQDTAGTDPLLVLVTGSSDGLTWWVGATTVTLE